MATGGKTDNNIENVCEEETYTTITYSENLENDEDNRSILVSSMDVGKETASVVRRRVQHIENTAQCVKILFVGKAGAGKSSLINGLAGQKIAEEGAGAKPVTGISALEKPYECEIQTDDSLVQIRIWDSPGLQDGYQDDKSYLERLRVILSGVDLLVYCISMQQRFDDSAQRALKKFAILEPEIWSHTVIALTQANLIIHPGDNPTQEEKTTYVKDIMTQWDNEIRNVLQQCPIPPNVIKEIPCVLTGYHRVTDITPRPWYLHSQCNHWLQPFWVNCLARCKAGGRQALIASNQHRFSCNDTPPGNSPIQEQRLCFFDNARKFALHILKGTLSYDKTRFSFLMWFWHSFLNRKKTLMIRE